jgi:serine/threonine-protein kinase
MSGREGHLATCAELDAFIAAGGAIDAEGGDAARFAAHLEACSDCAELARLYRASSGDDDDSAAAPAPEPEPGAVIGGRYRLEVVLGRGGMGVVWAATQIATGQEVALKLLRRGGALRARRRALREARAAASVRHPNVVRVYDVVETDDGAPAIVMERLHGESLGQRMKRGRIEADELRRILGRVADGLAAAHDAGVVHRDLKPENVFLVDGRDGEGSVKVLDFGVAKHDRDGAATSSLTDDGAMVGTPYYMAPEQALGDDGIDARADVWALGLMLYQGLSGRLPTRAENIGRVFRAIVVDPIAPLASVAPDAPRDLAALVDRMLAKERDGRPRRMSEIAAELAGPPVAATTADGRPPSSRRPVVLAAGALCAATIAAGVVAWSSPAPRTPTAAPELAAVAPAPTPTGAAAPAPREPPPADPGVAALASAEPSATPKPAPPAHSAVIAPPSRSAAAEPASPIRSATRRSIGVEREF